MPKKQNKPVKIFIKLLLTTLSILIIFFAIYYFISIKNPPKYSLGIVIYSDPISIIFSRKPNGEGRIIKFPKNVQITSVGGFGQFEISSLWRLSEQEKNPEIFTRSLSEAVGVPIGGYVGLKDNSNFNNNINLISLLNLYLSNKLSTNLTLQQLIAINNLQIGSGLKDTILDLTRKDISTTTKTPDDRDIEMVDINKIDYHLNSSMYLEEITQEGLKVAVINSTDIPLVGKRAARILNLAGVNVVSVGNENLNLVNCIIETNPKYIDSKTFRFIQDIYSCDIKQENVLKYPADLIVYMGSNYANKIIGVLK